MLRIETAGSWSEMGEQVGEAFRDRFELVLDRFAPWLASDLDGLRPEIAGLRRLLGDHCPELIEETEGMARAVGLDPDLMLGLRYFNELREHAAPGCSGLFLAESDCGPLLARTCDIEPDLSAEIQLLRVNRPDDGPATVLVTYLVLTGGVGLTEHGLAMTGSSATPKVNSPRGEGLPIAVVNHLLMTRCRGVEDARELLETHQVRGKGAVELVCDESGKSVMVEYVPGQPTIVTERAADRDWQACSNFCFSGGLTNSMDARYLQNAYARYGRVVHQVGEGIMDRSVDGVKQLFLEISQPGMVCPEEHCFFHTAYAFVIDVRARKMHLCPGHPAKEEYMEIVL